ncbi:hypothetical protein SNE40_013235 [Patella caerulea]|uniref:Uncharacterized protein n=1 Tax=Patella caerulea TaxID=87958 RepID=A0AAN8JLS3_PATCE
MCINGGEDMRWVLMEYHVCDDYDEGMVRQRGVCVDGGEAAIGGAYFIDGGEDVEGGVSAHGGENVKM